MKEDICVISFKTKEEPEREIEEEDFIEKPFNLNSDGEDDFKEYINILKFN